MWGDMGTTYHRRIQKSSGGRNIRGIIQEKQLTPVLRANLIWSDGKETSAFTSILRSEARKYVFVNCGRRFCQTGLLTLDEFKNDLIELLNGHYGATRG